MLKTARIKFNLASDPDDDLTEEEILQRKKSLANGRHQRRDTMFLINTEVGGKLHAGLFVGGSCYWDIVVFCLHVYDFCF